MFDSSLTNIPEIDEKHFELIEGTVSVRAEYRFPNKNLYQECKGLSWLFYWDKLITL